MNSARLRLQPVSGLYRFLGPGRVKRRFVPVTVSRLTDHPSLRFQSQSSPSQVPQQATNHASPMRNERAPVEKQLKVYENLKTHLPRLFVQPMDYTIYHKDLLFVNNLLGRTTTGLASYVKQVAMLRTVGHFKFAFVRMNLLSTSHDVEEARITVRWRIVGVSGIKIMLKFWKFKFWKREELQSHQDTWYDGISYFDIGTEGTIVRHIADKIDEDKDRVTRTSRTPFAAKLAVLAALCPKPLLTQDLPDCLVSCL